MFVGFFQRKGCKGNKLTQSNGHLLTDLHLFTLKDPSALSTATHPSVPTSL